MNARLSSLRLVSSAARSGTVLASLALAAAGCGGLSYRYDTGSVRRITGTERLRAVATDALDARANGAPLPPVGDAATARLRENELRDVRAAVREHLVRAGVVGESSPTLRAPTSAAEVEGALAEARAAGASEVVFVRYHRADWAPGCGSVGILAPYLGILPWLIIDSIPLWSHGAFGAFEVVVAQAETGEVLGRSARVAAFSEHVSAWGCGADGVMHDMMRRSLESALEDVVAQASAGWPSRSGAGPAVAAVLAPAARVESGRVVGLGWNLAAPAGYELLPWDPAAPARAIRLSRSEHENLDVTIVATSLDAHDFAHHAGDALRGAPGFVEEHATSVGGLDAQHIEVVVDGVTVWMRATAAEGMGILVSCAGAREACEPALSSLAVDSSVLADGHRS